MKLKAGYVLTPFQSFTNEIKSKTDSNILLFSITFSMAKRGYGGPFLFCISCSWHFIMLIFNSAKTSTTQEKLLRDNFVPIVFFKKGPYFGKLSEGSQAKSFYAWCTEIQCCAQHETIGSPRAQNYSKLRDRFNIYSTLRLC